VGSGQEIKREEPILDGSRCHVFIDYDFIWTLEMVKPGDGSAVPILNIITFGEGEWDFRPEHIHIMKDRRREAQIDRFSIDTGVPGEPYGVPYLKVLGDSFIGMDLIGDFQGFEEPRQISIDLGNNRFTLEPVDCLEYENIAHRINQVNFETPDIHQDYEILGIETMGKREARRQYY
jgi:hypothetical protein